MITTNTTRKIVLDTETTGMNMAGGPAYLGHRIIEIGAVEIINRRLTGNHFHVYIKPDRLVEPEAYAVHGISDEFLQDKPEFKAIYQDFYQFIKGAELIIHNASFDVGFINNEFHLIQHDLAKVETFCTITDTLAMARRLFPGKRNNLDILCERYHIDNSHRVLHGALLDAEILAEVYLAMTGGQTSMAFNVDEGNKPRLTGSKKNVQKVKRSANTLRIIKASDNELLEHEKRLAIIEKKHQPLWYLSHEA